MTVDIASLVSDNLDIWTTAVERKSGAGRGGGKRISLYGIDRLRALILELAVLGRLVPQDGNEEPAAALIDRIPDDWAAAKRRHRSRSSAADQPAEPSKTPSGWCAVAGNIIFRTRSGNSKLIKGTLHSEDGPNRFPGFSASGQDVWLDDYEHEGVAIILSAVGARCGKAFLARGKWSAVANTHIIWLLETVTDPDFAMLVLNNENYWDRAGGAQPFVKVGNTLDRDFLLPPLAEQKRIVAKVDELMALCDALEAESAAAMAAHQALVEALLATLTTSTDAADLATNWARLKAHFDTLFTTEASVDALKQTILELAVRGKLVPQVPTDEPAAVMLKAVKKSGSNRGAKHKAHSTIADADRPFDLPNGWCWERFDNLIEPDFPIAYGVLVPGADQTNGIPFVRIADLSITDPAPLPEKSISADVDAQFPRTRLRGGEILMGVVGSIGKLGVAPASWAGANIARAICRIVPSPLLDRSYVLWLLQSDFMQNSFIGDTRTLAQPTLNIGLIRLAATPVPPVAEQKRIVAKIEELMVLCDALKTRITDVSVTQKHLADTIVEQAAA